jgi:pimeloyl-ACP methyl ester carboxylesterase
MIAMQFRGEDLHEYDYGKDGTTIYYKDWGSGPVVTFSHGWPLNSDAWDGQLHSWRRMGSA